MGTDGTAGGMLWGGIYASCSSPGCCVVLAAADSPAVPLPPSLQQGKSSSTGNLLDKDDIAIPPPDYGMSSQAFPSQNVNTFKQRPYSVAVPAFSQVSRAAMTTDGALLNLGVF